MLTHRSVSSVALWITTIGSSCRVTIAPRKKPAAIPAASPTTTGTTRFIDLTTNRLHLAIYFFLHRSSLPENTADSQALSKGAPRPQKFRQKLYVRQNRVPGALECSRVSCDPERIE